MKLHWSQRDVQEMAIVGQSKLNIAIRIGLIPGPTVEVGDRTRRCYSDAGKDLVIAYFRS